MGASGPIKNNNGCLYQYCNICGLKISWSEYVLMAVGFAFDEHARLKTEEARKEFCNDKHAALLKLQHEDKYDYERAFSE